MAEQGAQVKNLGQVAAVIESSVEPKNKKVLWYDERVVTGCPFKYFDKNPAVNRWVTLGS
jgi:ribosomal protein L6P/L9E